MLFEIAVLFYQLMAIIVGSVTFLGHIKDLPNKNSLETVFIGLCLSFLSAVVWPFTIAGLFQDSDWRLKDLCCTKHQFVTLLVILAFAGYIFHENELLQKSFFPEKYWTKRIEELNSAIQFNQRMIIGLSAYDFHTDQQEQDLIMQRQYLRKNYRDLEIAKKNLDEYSRR